MTTVKLQLRLITNHFVTIQCNLVDGFKTWTKQNQLLELVCAKAFVDINENKIYYTRNLISVELLEDQ